MSVLVGCRERLVFSSSSIYRKHSGRDQKGARRQSNILAHVVKFLILSRDGLCWVAIGLTVNIIVLQKVTSLARQNVYMHVRYGLTCRGSVLDCERKSISTKMGLELWTKSVGSTPEVSDFLPCKILKTGNDATRDDEHVPRQNGF
jgi:hypothetical protein